MPSKKKELTHLTQLVVVFLLAIILRFSDPLTQNVVSMDYVQHLVPTKIYITQLLDPLKSQFKNTIPSYFTISNTKKTFSGNAKQFLSSNFFESDSDAYSADFLKSLGDKFVSPLTTTMMMMGCYGDIQSNTQLQANVTSDSAVLFNVLLQTLEYNFGSKNDKSACSCLKDFANPQLASAKKQILVSAGKIENSDSHHLHYDSCQSQNLQDYVYNGNEDAIDVELKSDINDKPYIAMSTDYIARTQLSNFDSSKQDTLLGQRNRKDPMLYELEQLLAKILNTNLAAHLEDVKSDEADESFLIQKSAWIQSVSVKLNKTIVEAEEQELWKQEMIDAQFLTEMAWKTSYKENLTWSKPEQDAKILEKLRLWHISNDFPDFLPMFTNILHNHLQLVRQAMAGISQSVDSDADRDEYFRAEFYLEFDRSYDVYNPLVDSWKRVYKNTDLIQESDVKYYRVTHAFQWLTDYIQDKMYAHNKLRAPIYTGDSSKVNSASQPPTMDLLTYQNYVHKYAAAYKMCSFAGIPAYQTVPRHKIESTTYTHNGNAYLLYSVFIAFVYWNHQSTKVEEALNQTSKPETDSEELEVTSDANTSTVAAVIEKYYIYEIVVSIIGVLFLVQLFLVQVDITSDNLYVEYNNVGDHLKFPKFPLFAGIKTLTWIFFVVFVGSIVTLAYKLLQNKKKPLNHNVEILAQIAMDVGIIAGFSSNGIAVFLQQGLGNEYLIVFVFLTLIVTSFLQHLSNVMRLLQQMNIKNEMQKANYKALRTFAAYDSKYIQSLKKNTIPAETLKLLNEEIEKHTGRKVGMNRTLAIMVIIILLAGIGFSAAQTYDIITYDVLYNYNHMWIFLGVVFFVLCAFDILHEVASFSGKAIHPYEQHSQKLLWTAWALVLGLLFLHFHQFIGLCATYEEFDAVEGDSKNLCNYPKFLWMNSWEMKL